MQAADRAEEEIGGKPLVFGSFNFHERAAGSNTTPLKPSSSKPQLPRSPPQRSAVLTERNDEIKRKTAGNGRCNECGKEDKLFLDQTDGNMKDSCVPNNVLSAHILCYRRKILPRVLRVIPWT
jgi:hypothetical protein